MMSKKKKTDWEGGVKKAGSILGKGLDWYFGADRRKSGNKSSGNTGVLRSNEPQYKRGSFSEFLISGKQPKREPTEEEKKKSKSEIHIHIHQ